MLKNTGKSASGTMKNKLSTDPSQAVKAGDTRN